MPKARATTALEDDVLRAVKIKATRSAKRDSQVIEESLHRDVGLDEIAEIWVNVRPATEAEGMRLATDELCAVRQEARRG